MSVRKAFRSTALAVACAGSVSGFTPHSLTSRFTTTHTPSPLTFGHRVSALQVSTTVDASSSAIDDEFADAIGARNPLKVIIAGAGVGGLTLAMALSKHEHMQVTVVEQTSKFQRFGGPIQLASNAMQLFKVMDGELYNEIRQKFTITGDKENGIKDGIRNEWYAKFDLKTPAADRNLPYTGVIDRPDLQEILLRSLPPGTVQNGDGVDRYEKTSNGVKAILQSGAEVYGDVLIGADGIWSAVRASMSNTPRKGDGSGKCASLLSDVLSVSCSLGSIPIVPRLRS
jgi:zeaxanthin epoxidase